MIPKTIATANISNTNNIPKQSTKAAKAKIPAVIVLNKFKFMIAITLSIMAKITKNVS